MNMPNCDHVGRVIRVEWCGDCPFAGECGYEDNECRVGGTQSTLLDYLPDDCPLREMDILVGSKR